MLEATDFRGPEILTTAVVKLLGEVRDVEILDVGAGTGLSGLAVCYSLTSRLYWKPSISLMKR